jgi:DNA-binding GntR family transcriptional regulator
MNEASTASTAKSLTSLAFERIRSDILTANLRPAEKLRIQALSERYGIGATAVREALSRLVTDGLVESEDQRGFCVAPVSKEDLIDLTNTRIEIEGMALRKAIARGDLDWEAQILSSYHRLSRTPPPTSVENHLAWAVAHRRFHESLVSHCGSPWLLRLCSMLYDKSERYRNLAEGRTKPGSRDTVNEHKALMKAVAMDRDADKAIKLLGDHFRKTAAISLEHGVPGAEDAAE